MNGMPKPFTAVPFSARDSQADLLATRMDPNVTRLSSLGEDVTRTLPTAEPEPEPSELQPSLVPLSSSNPRHMTALPHVDSAGTAIQLKPRAELRYHHVRKLGAGAMGEVNLAKDNDIGRTVAVKHLVAGRQNPLNIARFIEEIRTIGQFEHPNIVPIHDAGVDDKGQIFFVMKHVDGETLEEIINKLDAGDPAYVARYTMDYRLEIFLGLLRALQCAHAKGVIHRDVKPANVTPV